MKSLAFLAWRTARLASRALNVVLPPLCVSCGQRVSSLHGFCAACWAQLDFIAPPYCVSCGLPFAFSPGADETVLRCGACLQEPPGFAAARAPLSYTESARRLVVPFKHRDATALAPALARLMRQAGAALLQDSDVIVPVPLHGWRLFLRRYNQAALLAVALGKMTGKPVALDMLCRTRPTPPQGRLRRALRLANVKGAFSVPEKAKGVLDGKKVLLVDDVMTTGATANACVQALQAAGAKRVNVLTLARVAKEHD